MDRQTAINNAHAIVLDAMAAEDQAREDLIRVQKTVERSERLVREALVLLADLQASNP